MGYVIQYEPEKNKKYPISVCRKRLPVGVIVTMLILMIVGIGIRMKWLVPGDPQVTADAFSAMVDDIADGEPIDESVAAFCGRVLSCGMEN